MQPRQKVYNDVSTLKIPMVFSPPSSLYINILVSVAGRRYIFSGIHIPAPKYDHFARWWTWAFGAEVYPLPHNMCLRKHLFRMSGVTSVAIKV